MDGYTPGDQVEAIQSSLLRDVLQAVLGCTHTQHLYLDSYCRLLEPDSDSS